MMAASRLAGHAARLEQAYRAVGERTWTSPDFLDANLAVSRDLFTPESLRAGTPRPRSLEVIALLSGLPFPPAFVAGLVHVQQQVSEVIGPCLHYWVAPGNFGLEYCVFKWPDGPWQPEWLGVIRQLLAERAQPAFRYEIGGIQVNPDGCVIAKGFDDNEAISRVRTMLRKELPFLPERQSGWAHVPLGRILEPVGTARFAELQELMQSLASAPVAAMDVESMSLVHETRWYMEEKQILEQYPLATA